MTDTEKARVDRNIENEGFDYTFMYYSDFADIKDEEFHKLRKQYLEARENLRKYII